MKRCSVVIGSMWGDEGKGHMTDILCNSPNTLNVRFNGGAQASHTVVTPDGKRHAFRHFGAGTFAGAKTYLSEHFIVNTVAFVFERNELSQSFGIIPYLYVNPNALVTTLWDMYINQAMESLRGEKRHGSCGFGINETVERSRIEKYKITVRDLISRETLIEKLLLIQNEYVPMRLKEEYGVSVEDFEPKYQALIRDAENIDMFLYYVQEFLDNVQIVGDSVLNKFDNVVFEGAQGLLLDQNNSDYFPHVTTSNTGIKNVMDILKSLNYRGRVDIYYMSRCYMTRHGAGPFKNELSRKPYEEVEDLTNVHNEFQGSLRFGYLDFDLLSFEINKDLQNLILPANIYITFSCLDQVGREVKYYQNGELRKVAKNEFLDFAWWLLSDKIGGLENVFATCGLTRDDFIEHKKEKVDYA